MGEGWEYGDLEAALGYEWTNRDLLIEALRHRSYAEEHPGTTHNGRLAFLGDAVLQLVVTELLITNASSNDTRKLRQGTLTERRKKFVNNKRLATLAEPKGIVPKTGIGEAMIFGRAKKKRLASAVEAIIAAHYEDNGFKLERTTNFVRGLFEHDAPDTNIWT